MHGDHAFFRRGKTRLHRATLVNMVEERATLAPFLHCCHHANTDRLQLTFPHRRTVVCSCPLVSAARERERGMTCTQRRPVVIIRRRRRRRARRRRCVFPPSPFSPPPLTDTAVIHRVAAATAAQSPPSPSPLAHPLLPPSPRPPLAHLHPPPALPSSPSQRTVPARALRRNGFLSCLL